MKKYCNGQYVELTEAEQKMLADCKAMPSAPSLEDRLAALEAVQDRLLTKLQAFLSI